MEPSMTVFEKTKAWYKEQLEHFDLPGKAAFLGAEPFKQEHRISFLAEPFGVCGDAFFHEKGRPLSFSEEVVLCNYILRCPAQMPQKGGWITWREVPGSGALSVYVSTNARKVIEKRFSNDLFGLEKASRALGGEILPSSGHDFSARFDLLPRIPLTLCFNFSGDDFPASCTLLFAEDVSHWLDTESLSILAVLFAGKLTASPLSCAVSTPKCNFNILAKKEAAVCS